MKRLGLALAAAAGLGWLYRARLRDRHMNWGATPKEIAMRLSGDELLEDADIVANRAVGIDAPPSGVWPWLVQMGPGRGGAYTYDWIENLFGLGMHSSERIHPEWQQLEIGGTPSVKPGSEPGPNAMRVRVLEPERALVTASDDGKWVWGFYLFPDDDGTRLLSRNRIKTSSSLPAKLGMAVMTLGSWVMERKMLLGIKERAERLHRESKASATGPRDRDGCRPTQGERPPSGRSP
jgi:hypothetical protein